MRRWLDRVRLRLRSLLRGEDVDRALRREIEGHLADQIDEHVAAGMTPSEARAAALRAFGPVARIADECRDTRRVAIVENLGRDLRYSLRALARQPLLVAAAVASIGVATAANTVIFSLAHEMLLAAPTAARPDRLAYIRVESGSHVSFSQWRDLHESNALAAIAGYQIEIEANWSGPARSTSLMPLAVTPNFFDALGIPMASGRGFTTAEAWPGQPGVAVISHAFWQNDLAGDPAAIGRVLTFNGQAHTVVGILPPETRGVAGLGIAPRVYLPLSRSLLPDLDDRQAAAVMLIGRLHDGQTPEQARHALQAVVQRLDGLAGSKELGGVQRFTPAAGLGKIRGFAFEEIAIFFGVLWIAVALVLAIACANVAGLLLSRGTTRRREVAVRSALGAGRVRLMQQFLAEAFWLALFGTALGVLLSRITMGVLSAIELPLPLPFTIQPALQPGVLILALASLIVTTLLCGVAPAFRATRPSLVPALKQEEAAGGHRRWTLRTFLVIGQVAVSLVLLLTAFLFLRNLSRAHELDPGFDTARTLVAQISFVEGRHTAEGRAALLRDAAGRLRALPGIRAAACAHAVPLTLRSGMTSGADLQLAGGEVFRARYEVNLVGPDYFSALGIPLLGGRDFALTDRAGSPAVVIINEEFVRRYLGGSSPLGRTILLPGPSETPRPAEIVGVVGNSKHRTIGEEQQPAIYEAYLQRRAPGRLVHMLVRADEATDAAADDVERVLRSMDPTAAVSVVPMRSALAFAFLPSQIGASLLGALGLLGLGLAMVGLYATIAYSVARRTAEIGIRMALGASRAAVVRLVLGGAALVSGVGIAIGLAAAAFITKPLAMFLVAGLSASDPLSFAGTALLLFAVSLAAAASPARRATRIDPVTALRME